MKESPAQAGTLSVVGTPIGNLGDLSPRAVEVLQAADLIVCEDTRRTGSLLSRHGIENPGMAVMNKHTERDAADRVTAALQVGSKVAIVTDAGMPTISDPGALVVAAATTAGHDVVVVPGPTAVSAALALSGFVGARYVFEGFLPRKGGERSERLDALVAEQRIIVLYEAPHRIERTVADLADRLGGQRSVAIARELTKLHETVWRGVLADAVEALGEPRGEYVVVVDEAPAKPDPSDGEIVAALDAARRDGCSTRDAVARVVAATGVAKNRIYGLATSQSD